MDQSRTMDPEDAMAQLLPEHHLLQEAQAALQQQLAETNLRLTEELREKKHALKVTSRSNCHSIPNPLAVELLLSSLVHCPLPKHNYMKPFTHRWDRGRERILEWSSTPSSSSLLGCRRSSIKRKKPPRRWQPFEQRTKEGS